MARKQQYLLNRDGRFFARLVVPKDLRKLIGKTELREPLGPALTDELVTELETMTGAGIGTLFQRLMAQAFKLGDLAEVIRLGLIGGGANPQEAERLVNSYARNRPIAEVLPLATEILAARWLGVDEVQANG